MICPKCQNRMQTVDKSGIHIDQCESCRGIFLDRGELEAIVGAENSYYGHQQPPPYQPGPAPTAHYGRGYPDSPKGYRDSPRPHYGYSDSPRPYGHGKRRKRGFLEDLFD